MMKVCCFVKNYTQVYHWELSPDERLLYSKADIGKFIQGWNAYIYDNNITSEEEAIERLKEEHLNYLQDQIDDLNSTISKINLLEGI